MARLLFFSMVVCCLWAERYVAIDNVCAWPNVKVLPDGRVMAVIFNQPGHGGREGDVEAWVSGDGGKLWERSGTVAPHEPGTLRVNVAFGLAHDGAPVVLAAGAVVERPRSDIWLPVWASRSEDGGKTWRHAATVKLPEGADHLIPYGDIVQLPGRRLAASFYLHYGTTAKGLKLEPPRKGPGGTAYVLFSEDDGRSWGNGVVIGKDDYNETTLLRVRAGRMLAAARTYRDAQLELFASEDEGRTWTREGPISLPRQIPASLLRLADGRILVTYGVRERANRGVAVRVSADEGRTWEAAWPIVKLDGARDSGYPSTVQLGDGTLVTAWYASGIVQHERYHMGVLRWKLEPAR